MDAKTVKLQKKWYKKLAKEGFEDLEAFGADGEALPLMRGKNASHLRAKQHTMSETRHFYNLLTNFLTHNAQWTRDPFARNVAVWYAAGVGHLKIIEKGRASKRLRKHKIKFNLFTVHKTIKKFCTLACYWNKSHPDGLDYQSDI